MHLFKRIKQCITSFSQSLLITSHIGVLGTDHENTSPASKDIATFLPAKCIFLKPNPANIIMYIHCCYWHKTNKSTHLFLMLLQLIWFILHMYFLVLGNELCNNILHFIKSMHRSTATGVHLPGICLHFGCCFSFLFFLFLFL